MAKKKKSGKKKGGKLAKMSEEERILFLEQKALAEEELRKKKEDLLMQFLKDKLGKEEKSTKVNLNRLNQQWRQIMRDSKSKDLRKDIEILSQTFERVVDRKDSVIKALATDIGEAEEQYAVALRSHIQNIDDIVDLQRSRLDRLKCEYNDELNTIKKEFEDEGDKVTTDRKTEQKMLQDVSFAMEQNYSERESDARQEFQSMRDEIKNKNLEEKHALRIQLEASVEALWKQFQAALKSYNETTEERKIAFENLKSKDEKSAKEIEMQMKKLQRIQDTIMQLRAKMQQNTRECEERNRHLKEERELILRHFQELKSEMNTERERDRVKLTTLTLQSNNSIKTLSRVYEKGDRILKLAEMCRKLETEEEKVLPFFASSLTKEEEEDIDAAMMEEPSEPLSGIMHEYHALENFWKRYNKVLLDKLALDKEKQTLAQENQQLRTVLKQYLDGISVNDEILSQSNPLFVVNHKTNVKLSVPVLDPRVRRPILTVVEAAHVVKHITTT
ncbi:dynein regulatory complex subunit 2-like isoform X2 [Styela clava]|uniref:dynein regulatory complex subunit 2-like n=1 Tax=Styela clava TaxID=7725 RepID=UPI00193A9ED5|nr:dynein regulatory complex subunit 2-like [Styela clava]